MKQSSERMGFLVKYRRHLRNELAEMGYGRVTESAPIKTSQPRKIRQEQSVTPESVFVFASKVLVQ